MWLFSIAILVIFNLDYLQGQLVSPVTEVYAKQECADPNAEKRYDNPQCVVTCTKRSIKENPGLCTGRPQLKEGCYCKQGFYYDEPKKTCVQLQDCSCNAANNEISVFTNRCGGTCSTFHTLTRCTNMLQSQCWCKSTYCRAQNGTCISKE